MLGPQVNSPRAGAGIGLSGFTVARPARVAYLGTSIMAGNGNGAGGSSTTANQDFYPGTLAASRVNLGGQMAFHIARNLSFRAITVATPCTGGSYLSSANNAAANPLLEWQVPRAIANRPTHAIINSGTNEAGAGTLIDSTTLATYKSQMRSVVRALQAHGIRVIIQTIPPRPASATVNANAALINTAWTEVAYETGADLWDIFKFVSTATNSFVTGANASDNVHLDGASLATIVDAACAQILPLFPFGADYSSGAIARSTAAAPTDNLIGGVFDGIVGGAAGTAFNTAVTSPGTWNSSPAAGAIGNVTFSKVAGKGDEAAGQRWIGEMLQMACTGQYTARHSVSDFSTQMPAASRFVIGAWIAQTAYASDASRMGCRFTFFDAGSSNSYRTTLLDGSPQAFSTEALIQVEVSVPAFAIDGTTAITQAHFDMGQNGNSATNNTLQVAHPFVTRVA